MVSQGDPLTYTLLSCDVIGDANLALDIPFRGYAYAGKDGCKLWCASRKAVELANGLQDILGRVRDRPFLGSEMFDNETRFIYTFLDNAEQLARGVARDLRSNEPLALRNNAKMSERLLQVSALTDSLLGFSVAASTPLNMRREKTRLA